MKRVYEKPAARDGLQILAIASGGAGVTKQRAAGYLWLKEVAPSTKLRQNLAALARLKQACQEGDVAGCSLARLCARNSTESQREERG